jgi:FtsH-binding integral membrane protein
VEEKKDRSQFPGIILMGRRSLHFMTIIGAQKMNRYIEAGIKAILLLVCTVYVLWVTDTIHIMMGWPY